MAVLLALLFLGQCPPECKDACGPPACGESCCRYWAKAPRWAELHGLRPKREHYLDLNAVNITAETVQVLGHAKVNRGLWQEDGWTPAQPPFPSTHFSAKCVRGKMDQMRLPGLAPQPMCLPPSDWISDYVRRTGRWEDCSLLVDLWLQSETLQQDTRGEHGNPGLFVDLGANIGCCTLELLLRTTAYVLAFEPNPLALFYLTRTLKLAAQSIPQVAKRVAVFPFAAGCCTPYRAEMYFDSANLGNAVLHRKIHGRGGPRNYSGNVHGVPVWPLDAVVDKSTVIRLMKLDVQGTECQVLRGAAKLLAHSVQTITAESSPQFLLAQRGCHHKQLHALMRRAGFRVRRTRSFTEAVLVGTRTPPESKPKHASTKQKI
mmetsp:Transcript_2646/g.4569  ORF Transcript_2646/g.4569 Transcript_2646/m.4569 type:complete len:375 (+) Transcript_2646:68-1192(+)